MKAQDSGRTQAWAEIAMPVVLLLVPFWTFLSFHSYSIVNPAALVIALALSIAGATYGLGMFSARSKALKAVLMSCIIFISVDLLFKIDGYETYVLLFLLGLTWILGAKTAYVVMSMCLAFGASDFAFGEQEKTVTYQPANVKGSKSLPPLLHVILDAHIGIEGIPIDFEEGVRTKAEAISTYLAHDFRLFTNAYSAYYETANAIPNEFNFTTIPLDQGWLGKSRRIDTLLPLVENQYFERLAREGYSMRVYGPNYLDYCVSAKAPPSFCLQESPSSLGQLPALNLDWYSNVQFITAYWVTNNSSSYNRIRRIYEQQLRPSLLSWKVPVPHWKQTNVGLGPASALKLIERLSNDLKTIPDLHGTAFLVHLILPHAPYLLDENCHAFREFNNLLESGPRIKDFPERRRVYNSQYLAQLRCATKKVDDLVTLLESRGSSNAVIIVQGDHGSRIGQVPGGPTINKQTFKDFFSTLFAVRAQGIPSGIDKSPVALHEILDTFTNTGVVDASGISGNPQVFLRSKSPKVLVPTPIPTHFFSDAGVSDGVVQ